MVVRKGWNPQEPISPGQTSAAVTEGEQIMSGMCIVKVWNSSNARYEWTKADSAVSAHRATVPHFALQDWNTADVRASGLLTGFSCAGQFELQTGYFATGSAPISDGAPLTYGTSADEGMIKTCARGDGPTVPIVGYLTEDHHAGAIDLTGVNSEASDLSVVRFNTAYDPQNAAS